MSARKITNRNGYPEALVRAVTNDPYSKGDCDFSVTELIAPPQQKALEIKYADQIVEDVDDRIWSLLGQCGHTILERANLNDIAEKRFFADFMGYKVSGQVDTLCIDDGILCDYKVTTAYKFKHGKPPPEEYTQQLNMQLEILRRNGLDAKRLRIVGILRDYSPSKAVGQNDYPRARVASHWIPMWTRDQTTEFIVSRIKDHARARSGEFVPCSHEERWPQGGGYAIMKQGNKRATQLVPGIIEAQEIIANDQTGKLYIEERPATYMRCESYCSVKNFCPQFNNQLKKASGDE